MLTEPIEAPAETSPAELRDQYEAALAETVAAVGVDDIVESTGLDPATVQGVASGEAADLALQDAAGILSLRDGAPDSETILSEVRDHLLLAMSSAMLTVDRIAADVEGDLDPKEIQGKIEGRHPMTIDEYARINYYVAASA